MLGNRVWRCKVGKLAKDQEYTVAMFNHVGTLAKDQGYTVAVLHQVNLISSKVSSLGKFNHACCHDSVNLN